MSAIDEMFGSLRSQRRKAFMPFITAGDPDLEFTADVLVELGQRGANLCELGIPYSDPIADGPVIQASYTRALARHLRLAEVFEMLGRTRPKLTAPLVTMVSYAIVYRHGPERFVAEAQAAGVAGAIVPDLLVEESEELAGICRRADFSLVQLVTPTTPRDRALRIAEMSTGFLYYVSVTGITGERTALPASLVENVGWLRARTRLPICIGFGVGTAEHARLLAPVADGLIVGSAIVRRMAEAAQRPRQQVVAEIGDFVAELLAAMD
ncbi:MAG TPA: tryptophan synthase subunit alpha [Pirellulales bacterium]|jgi:tryptophan synthase alpha chain|nr:tryptophan synthase subunit alpha [Pirellulales bacterium]